MTQLRAIEILLRNSIPDLGRRDKTEQTHRYVIEIPRSALAAPNGKRKR